MAKDRLTDLSELLSAYLDGELNETVRAEVVAYLDRDGGAVQLLNELRETRSMLQDLPHQSAPAGFSEGVVSAVERQALLGGEPDTAARMSLQRRWGPIRAVASIALLVGAAGSFIYWQSDRWESTELARSRAVTADTITGRVTVRSDELDEYPSLNYAAVESIRRNKLRPVFKKGAHGKTASPIAATTEPGSRIQSAEIELARLQQGQSMGEDNLTTPDAAFDGEEVVALGMELDIVPAYSPEAGAEQVDFGLAGQLRGAPLGGAAPADFAGRLRANEPALSLAAYDFSNESNSLTLSFANAAQREEFRQKFEVYMVDNDFISASDPLERIQIVEPLIQNVLLRGLQGVNHAEPSSEQFLLNAAPEVLEGLIERYAETIGGGEDTTNIELQVGEMKVQGLESIRDIARVMAVPEVQQRILGVQRPTTETVDDAAADLDERLTAEQWHAHFARLGLAAKSKEDQAAVAKEGGADKNVEFAQSDDKSAPVADEERGKQDGWVDSRDPSPVRKAVDNKSSAPKEKVRQEEQVATTGEKDEGKAGALKKKRKARSSKGARPEKTWLFGDADESPPVSESADGSSRGRRAGGGGGGGGAGSGGGGGEAQKQLKRPGPSRPIGRAANLTFVLKLQTVPSPTPRPTPERAPLMGPPAPTSESDDSEE